MGCSLSQILSAVIYFNNSCSHHCYHTAMNLSGIIQLGCNIYMVESGIYTYGLWKWMCQDMGCENVMKFKVCDL